MEIQQIQELANKVKANISQVIVGKEDAVELLLTAIIASGHVLLEDVPGTGKTLLAKTLSNSMECSFQRIQFTPDLLPSDLTGIHFYNQKEGDFVFRPGPLFANMVLADEINRATPRTQASLLECMEERQISVDGETHILGRPFIVIATQNPIDNQGTFPLPEAQMDRFMLKMKLGYPSENEGVEILKRTTTSESFSKLTSVVTQQEIVEAQSSYMAVKVQDDLLHYIIQIAEATRKHSDISLGVSPRGTQALVRAAQAFAAVRGREYVLPDDIKYMVPSVLSHRLVFRNRLQQQEGRAESLLQEILLQVPVPSEEQLESSVK
ncbi:AAA family ATPase [Paenibacillus crassostreae]|uniref:Magnesium chelatase n=1 Tax=Paenibacillus crassostreae TaxID=1763538 RepID=A0A167GTW4_9BACL|nr:MoxR family ATPase [Paenibacillus crassostreae]AOZ92093.1 magnesium chelatase [Paenibacillus crassostreae]OAB77902.1 magnesium chelatase [Paenibacillus crassostreae]